MYGSFAYWEEKDMRVCGLVKSVHGISENKILLLPEPATRRHYGHKSLLKQECQWRLIFNWFPDGFAWMKFPSIGQCLSGHYKSQHTRLLYGEGIMPMHYSHCDWIVLGDEKTHGKIFQGKSQVTHVGMTKYL